MMPGKTGADLVETLRGDGLTVPIILVTGGIPNEAVRIKVKILQREGKVHVMDKPYDQPALKALVEQLLLR